MFNVYFIVDVSILIALLVLALLAVTHGGHRQKTNLLFAGFSLCVAVWIPANHLSNVTTFAPQVTLYANYAVFAASYGALALFTAMCVKLSRSRRLPVVVKRTLPFYVAVGLISATPLVVGGVSLQGDVYAITFGPLIGVYAFALFSMIGACMYALHRGRKRSQGDERTQLTIIIRGLLITLPLVVAFSFVLPAVTGNFVFTEFGISPLIILIVALYYGVIRHRLFDVRLAAVRTLAYVLSLGVLGLLYYVVAYVLSMTLFGGRANVSFSISPLNVFLALLLAFVFQPVKAFFDRITNSLFYRDRYNSEEFFAMLSNVLGTTTDLRDLLERAADVIGLTLKSEQAFFYLRERDGGHINAGLGAHENLLVSEADHLDGHVRKVHERIIVAENSARYHTVYAILKRRRIALLLPLFHGDSIVGYLSLGEQRGGSYTRHDLRVLETIADELVIAIQNAMSLEEVREVNATLQTRIDGATRDLRSKNERLRQLDSTKDEFISMASHQLRTPLTSVKGYISMILDGDAGPVTDQQKRFLNEAFESSVRMTGIIGDFLNVSRLQTGKFMLEKSEIDLAEIAASEVDHLQNTARMRGLEIKYTKPKHFPAVLADKSKIEQVMMNFMDNALFYAPNSKTVDVELKEDGGKATFTVRDHGIGVPKSEQAGLFTKFFRATNARKQRPDGTGVGIFLAKKVVSAHHGDIIFTSEEGKGSTFGFSLPLMKKADDAGD